MSQEEDEVEVATSDNLNLKGLQVDARTCEESALEVDAQNPQEVCNDVRVRGNANKEEQKPDEEKLLETKLKEEMGVSVSDKELDQTTSDFVSSGVLPKVDNVAFEADMKTPNGVCGPKAEVNGSQLQGIGINDLCQDDSIPLSSSDGDKKWPKGESLIGDTEIQGVSNSTPQEDPVQEPDSTEKLNTTKMEDQRPISERSSKKDMKIFNISDHNEDQQSETNPFTCGLKVESSQSTPPLDNHKANESKTTREKCLKMFEESSHPLRHSGSIPNIFENGTVENGSSAINNIEKFFPIYRLSMRLSTSLTSNIEIPSADNHRQYDKAGHLQKLSGRGFPYLNQWKRRYCVLTKGCLFLYEKDTSKGSDKNSTVIDLKYFDHVTEALQKETKKVSNVFIVTSQDRSFFDPGRHLFAADTLTEMHEWINKLRQSIELIRNNNRPTSKTAAAEPHEEQKEQEKEQNEGNNNKLGENKLHITEQTEISRKSKPEDEIDAKHPKLTQEKKDDIATVIAMKLKKQSEEEGKCADDGGFGEAWAEGRGDVEGQGGPQKASLDLGKRRSSSKRIVLQPPVFNIEAKPQLESITKNRTKGPAGRRAPQSRRTVLMKQRASSMSALQHEGQDAVSRPSNHKDLPEGVCEDELSSSEVNCLNSSQPILAYHYSSDEDSPVEREYTGSDRSLGMSASGTCSPPKSHLFPPPPPGSFSIEEVPNQPVKGLRVYLSEEGRRTPPTTTRLHHPQIEDVHEDLFEYRSLPRSLGKVPLVKSMERTSPYNRLRIPYSGIGPLHPTDASSSKLASSSGRASPDMDALDNLLMKRSLQSAGTTPQDQNDHEDSDGSTCRAIHSGGSAASDRRIATDEELTQTLKRFSSALQHLQHHTAELENRTRQMETEVNVSKSDVNHLQETTEGIRKDVRRLSDSVTLVSQEASRAKKEYAFQRQETEKLQKDALEALLQAKQSQEQFDTAKTNYELTMKELHSLISSIRCSFIITETSHEESKERKSGVGVTSKDEAMLAPENDKQKNIGQQNGSTRGKQSEDKKKSIKEVSQQKGGYQSFFQRPSSLIYGLASNKSSTSKKTKDKNADANKRKDEDKTVTDKQQMERLDKKQISENIEKGNKFLNKKTTQEKKEEGKKSKASEMRPLDNEIIEPKRALPRLATDNLPMMDDMEKCDRKPTTSSYGVSHVSINVNSALQSYNLEKPTTSPTITVKPLHKKPRPNGLNLSPGEGEVNGSHSNTSSPDSPTAPPIPSFSTQGIGKGSGELKSVSESNFPSQPPRSPPLQSVWEEKSSSRSRAGVFAISRQKSSPNIPVQRQSSAPMFPIQRQRSLGTVPEEGQLPRQASLMSVPEDRPVVDRTLPLSPSSSMVSFALSPSPSGERLDSFRERSSARNSMELVTGPVVASSMMQESYIMQLPPSSEFETDQLPLATSSLKRQSNRKKSSTGATIV